MENLEGTVPLTSGNYGVKDVDVYLWYNESSTMTDSFADGPVYYSDEDRGDITLEVVHVDEALSNLTNIRLSSRVIDNRVIRVWVAADHHFVPWEGRKPVTVRVRFGTPVFGGKLTGELDVISIGGGTMSHIGMIIHSTTLDTEEKVIEMYGGKKWERIIGKFLLGADETHDVNTTGGFSDSVVPAHRHGVINNEVKTNYHSETLYDYSFDAETISYTPGTTSKTVMTNVGMTLHDAGHYHTVPRVPDIPGGGTTIEHRIEVTGEALQSVVKPYHFVKGEYYTIINNTSSKVIVSSIDTDASDGKSGGVDTRHLDANEKKAFTASGNADQVDVFFNEPGTVVITSDSEAPPFVEVKDYGTYRKEGNMPPYKTVYIWERTE